MGGRCRLLATLLPPLLAAGAAPSQDGRLTTGKTSAAGSLGFSGATASILLETAANGTDHGSVCPSGDPSRGDLLTRFLSGRALLLLLDADLQGSRALNTQRALTRVSSAW